MPSRTPSQQSSRTSEQTPLLSRQDDEESSSYGAQANGNASPAVASLASIQESSSKEQRRWSTIVALLLLCFSVLAILGLGFAAPAVVEEYAKEALYFEPTNLSIDSITSSGVRARIQGMFVLDATKVHKKAVRDLGRAGTWVAREVETGESRLKVYLPEYGNVLLGTAAVPPIKVDIRDRHYNHLDFLADLEPGDVDGIRDIANDWLSGRLGSLRVRGVAEVPIRSGFLSLGTQKMWQEMIFGGNEIPKFPDFNIEKLEFDEYGPPGKPEGMTARAVVSLMNDYPVKFDIPPLRFDVLVPDCYNDYLVLGDAQTATTHILPKQNVNVSVIGLIRELPTSLTTACPGSNTSPLDSILGDYLKGKKTIVYVKGGKDQNPNTPDWIGNFIRDTTLPFPLPGHPFDNLIREFSLANVHFSLPDPFAEGKDANPTISATVKAVVGLPKEMNFNLDVDKVKADADIYYLGDKLGKLDLREWQPARTSKQDGDLLIESDVNEAPLEITNNDVFTDVVQALIFGGKGIILEVEAKVDVNSVTALGEFVLREIPAEGKVFVKPIGSAGFETEVGDLEILSTSSSTISLQARVNATNPTDYTAHVPFVNMSVSTNDTHLGYATAKDMDLVTGKNSIHVVFEWHNGASREFLSQYLSGYNTTLTVATHAGTIPSQPALGEALCGLTLTIDTPKLFDRKFFKDATLHLLSSTATFILVSPFELYITSIDAMAFYNSTEVGRIKYDYPFKVKAGESMTPKLPVEWSLGAGLQAVKDALGGTLALDAKGNVSVKVGEWQEKLWYEGSGIGASITW